MPAELEEALTEQRATGRRLGEVLVSRGALTGAQLTRALAEQYGIELPTVTVSALDSTEPPTPWQPLGRLLVRRGTITQAALDEALATQRSSDRKLGEVLVTEHAVTMLDLAAALSEQHGLAIEAGAAAPITSSYPDESFYEVKVPEGSALFRTDSFLEATDFAFEYLAVESPDVLEIVRERRGERERVWQCDQHGEPAAGHHDTIATYGFEPNAWTGPNFSRD